LGEQRGEQPGGGGGAGGLFGGGGRGRRLRGRVRHAVVLVLDGESVAGAGRGAGGPGGRYAEQGAAVRGQRAAAGDAQQLGLGERPLGEPGAQTVVLARVPA